MIPPLPLYRFPSVSVCFCYEEGAIKKGKADCEDRCPPPPLPPPPLSLRPSFPPLFARTKGERRSDCGRRKLPRERAIEGGVVMGASVGPFSGHNGLSSAVGGSGSGSGSGVAAGGGGGGEEEILPQLVSRPSSNAC